MRNAFLWIVLVACSSSGTRSDTAKLPPAQPQCDFVNYHRDESINERGPGQCATDCDCDGTRSCTNGSCTGVARPAPTDTAACDDPSYKWNEDWNGGGAGVCANDCECNGSRRCESGHCAAAPATAGDTSHTR